MTPAPRLLSVCLLLSAPFASSTLAAPVQWKVEDGGNGHYYELVRPGTNPGPSWTAARDAAAATSFEGASGHLATVTSEAEQRFINEQFKPLIFITWIGGIQAPDPTPGTGTDQGWSWITGEPWGYTAWLNGEPNDWGGLDERYLSTWVGQSTLNTWNDNSDLGTPTAYVVEYALPEPSSATLCIALGGVMLLRRARGTSRRRRR